MNDTETRLRDYLHTKAADVPDSAHGPGLELDATSTSTRRHWAPMALAAASIGAVLILAVPFLNSLGGNQPGTAGSPASGPVSAEAPRLPYSITVANNPGNPLDTWWATIRDGKTTVRNPGVKGELVARLGEGWLVTTGYPDPLKSQAAIVSKNGKLRPIGPLEADTPAISPDGKQLAIPVAPHGAKDSQVVVVNVADGREVSRLRIPTPMLSSFGWNKAGIWLYANNADRTPMYLWQPGTAEARKLPALGAEIALASGSDTFGYSTAEGAGYCAKAATLGSSGPEVKRQYCSDKPALHTVSLSPDGGTMVVGGPWVAVDVAGGKQTKLNLPAGLVGTSPVAFENATDLLVLGLVPGKTLAKPTAQTIYRCRVTTGECKALVTEKPGEVFGLGQR
ncbi:hypothetical protein [Kribbella ginsengisoli]